MRTAACLVGLTLAFVGVVGFAHTKPGRPLLVAMRPALAWMTGSRCPFGYDVKSTPAQKEAERLAFSRTHQGPGVVAARPALGFILDVTTQDDVKAWASTHGVSCVSPKAGPDLECSSIPDELLPEAERGAGLSSLWLNFGARRTLTSVVAVRNASNAEVISHAFSALKADVTREGGPPTSSAGEGTASELSSGLLVESSVEYRFQNYYALAHVANMGRAFVLTEEYRSLAN